MMSDYAHRSEILLEVLEERNRQIEVEGLTAARDDAYDNNQLARAAACYALGEHKVHHATGCISLWPFSGWWRPTTRRRNLIKALALLVAAVEALDRKAARETRSEDGG